MTANEYQRYLQGKINKAQGANFEREIDAACRYYRDMRQAHIEKNNEPFQVTKSLRGGQFVGHYKGESQTDYTGVLKGGRTICFEAKHTQTDRLQQAMVKPHQAADLDSKAELGAACYVLCGIQDRTYFVPWATFKNMKELYGHKYITQEEAATFEVKRADGILDFLAKA